MSLLNIPETFNRFGSLEITGLGSENAEVRGLSAEGLGTVSARSWNAFLAQKVQPVAPSPTSWWAHPSFMDRRTEQKREHPPSGMDTGRERHQRIHIRVGVAIGAGLEGHDDLDPLVLEPGGGA